MASGGFGGMQGLKEEITGIKTNLEEELAETPTTTTPVYVLERSTPVQKMPISYLQEMCTKREIKPEYELLSTEGQVRMTDEEKEVRLFICFNDWFAIVCFTLVNINFFKTSHF